MSHLYASRVRRLLVGHLLGAAAILLAACSGPGAAPSADQSPTAPAGEQQYTSSDLGFSVSYPAGFEAQGSLSHSVMFLAPQGTSGHRERGWITVERTFEPTGEWYANQVREANSSYGVEIKSSVAVLDGQQAYTLGGVPGQDPNRQVFVVKDGILYHMVFVPDNAADGENYQQMEELYTAILSSFRFLPEAAAGPQIVETVNMIHHLEHALNTRSADELASLLGDEFVLGHVVPAGGQGETSSRHGPAEVAPLIFASNLPQAPAVVIKEQVDWADAVDSAGAYAGFFPNEGITPVFATGWGPNGTDRAVLIIARRPDRSLYWRGAFMLPAAP